MRVGRRQASYKGSPDSDAVRVFLCLKFGSRNTPQDLSPSSLRLSCYVPLAPVSCVDASARDIKSVRLMASVREGV